jgi:N-acetylglutamate synthase-like GNAT family acetyltransferase
MIRPCKPSDLGEIVSIINDGAKAYKDVIPNDCWHEPYMSGESLQKDIENRVNFYIFEQDGLAAGVMGIQDFPEVTLIRHAYTRTAFQKKGVGATLLQYLLKLTDKPVLIGTWASTPWSIHFYSKYGFTVLPKNIAAELLLKYWPLTTDRHREVSVVLADKKWFFSKQIGSI